MRLVRAVNFSLNGWMLTGELNVGRSGHSATWLPNGTVLVVGGANSVSGVLRSAELYHPVTGIWALTGGTFYERESHTATLLSNGKVLVAGGTSSTNTELYDPAAGEWFATGRLSQTRLFGHTATLLQNGRVLVAGGFDPSAPFPDTLLSSAELYDPDTQVWTLTGALNVGRYAHTATLLPNGKVLVVGGNHGSGGPYQQILPELYDPATGTWTPTGGLFYDRFGHTATLLQDGKVIVAGGLIFTGTHNDSLDSVEMYDPASGNWTSVGKLNGARRYHAATLLPTGSVLVEGGVIHDLYSGGYQSLTSAELYDPATFTWTLTASLNVPRSGHTATLLQHRRVLPTPLQDNRVLVVGGAEGNYESSTELFDNRSIVYPAVSIIRER